MFPNFFGNRAVAQTLENVATSGRIPQTILLAGPEGVGKATLARRFAASLLHDAVKIEQDDLSLSTNLAIIADREKWPADKRNDDPLLFSTHPDFITFPPDGPLRQISIQQMRLLRERARYLPLHGSRRVFLVDHIDRANEQAANSLLKTLEEPPEHLIIMMTAENAYDLLPTIRSRAVLFHLSPLSKAEMLPFLEARALKETQQRLALANGSPGIAFSIDLESYTQRRAAMLALLKTASGRAPFGEWAKHSEALGAKKSEKLDDLLGSLYVLLEDLTLLAHDAGPIRNEDIAADLDVLAKAVDFGWLYRTLKRVDELLEFARRNIQKSVALDALALEMRQP